MTTFETFRLPEYDAKLEFYFDLKQRKTILKISYRWFFKWVVRKILSFADTDRGWLEAEYTYRVKRTKLQELEDQTKRKGRYGLFRRLVGRIDCILTDGCWLSPREWRQD